jgi:hypothetical protein
VRHRAEQAGIGPAVAPSAQPAAPLARLNRSPDGIGLSRRTTASVGGGGPWSPAGDSWPRPFARIAIPRSPPPRPAPHWGHQRARIGNCRQLPIALQSRKRASTTAARQFTALRWLELHPSASRGALIAVVQAIQDGHRANRPRPAPGLLRWLEDHPSASNGQDGMPSPSTPPHPSAAYGTGIGWTRCSLISCPTR